MATLATPVRLCLWPLFVHVDHSMKGHAVGGVMELGEGSRELPWLRIMLYCTSFNPALVRLN